MSRILKKLNILVVGCLIFVIALFNLKTVNAASFSISVSNSNIAPGEYVTLSLSGNGLEGKFDISCSNGATIIQGENPMWTGESIKIKAGSSSFKITATPKSVTDSSNAALITDALSPKTITVTVKNNQSNTSNSGTSTPSSKPQQPQTESKPETKKSSDATLSSLSVDKGTLSPEFSSSVTEYSVELNDDSTEITFSATANDSKATVENATTQPLKIGVNSFSIDVKAEDGTKKSYIVNVNVTEVAKVFVDSDNKMGILNNLEGINIPKGFSETKIMVNDQEVTALVNEDGSTTLLYLMNAERVKNFYIYDVNTKTYSLMEPIQLCGLDFAAIEIPESIQTKEGMTFQDITIDDKTYKGWKFNDENMQDYSLLYLMDVNGDIHYYMHYSPNNSIQVYDSLAPITLNHLDALTNEVSLYKNVAIGLGVLSGLLIIALIVVVMKNKKKRNEPKQEIKVENDDLPVNEIQEAPINEEMKEEKVQTSDVKEEFLSALPEGAAVIIPDEEDDFLNDVTKNMTEILKNSDQDNA